MCGKTVLECRSVLFWGRLIPCTSSRLGAAQGRAGREVQNEGQSNAEVYKQSLPGESGKRCSCRSTGKIQEQCRASSVATEAKQEESQSAVKQSKNHTWRLQGLGYAASKQASSGGRRDVVTNKLPVPT